MAANMPLSYTTYSNKHFACICTPYKSYLPLIIGPLCIVLTILKEIIVVDSFKPFMGPFRKMKRLSKTFAHFSGKYIIRL